MKKKKHQVSIVDNVYEILNIVSKELGMPKTQTIHFLLIDWLDRREISSKK